MAKYRIEEVQLRGESLPTYFLDFQLGDSWVNVTSDKDRDALLERMLTLQAEDNAPKPVQANIPEPVKANIPKPAGTVKYPVRYLKSWWPGHPDVEPFMGPIRDALLRHVDRRSSAFTDIYNRAYEAVYNALKKGEGHAKMSQSKFYVVWNSRLNLRCQRYDTLEEARCIIGELRRDNPSVQFTIMEPVVCSENANIKEGAQNEES